MRIRCSFGMLAAACCGVAATMAAGTSPDTQEVLANAPTDLAVTVYRSPGRDSGSITLDYLGGFALIRETRVVRVPAGLSRVRFEGVADGIEPASVIVAGLPNGVLEKNRDAKLLSPATLLAAAAGRPVVLVRANSKTGKTTSLPGVILSGPDADGIVFQTQDGIETLRCSGVAEAFDFSDSKGLSATPTLSVLVRSARPMTRRIQLAYLAYNFDWAADYTAVLSADEKTIDLGAWVTLANGNGVGFPAAHTQVVAGRLNRESYEVEPIDAGGPMLARCWPRGSTSDTVAVPAVLRAVPFGFEPVYRNRAYAMAASSSDALQEVSVTGSRVHQEQLGDLKLYRVPERTTVASHQSKQVRLLDRALIPVHKVFTTHLYLPGSIEADDTGWTAASVLLRTRNDAANHLGLPLPSGRVLVFGSNQAARLLLNEADIRDLAQNEELEIDMGSSNDVQVRSMTEEVNIDPARTRTIPLVPGRFSLRNSQVNSARRVEISNAQDAPVDFELRLQLEEGTQVIRADHALGTKNGAPMFALKIPANGIAAVRFQTTHSETRVTVPQ